MKKNLCPLLKKTCVEHECKFWTHMIGRNPQTAVMEDKHDCAITFMPILILETARNVLGAQAAVESMRNEVVERQDSLNHLISQASRRPQQIRDIPEETPQIGEKNGR